MLVREVLIEAVSFMGLPHRGQEIPANILQVAEKRFNDIMREYSGNSMLTAYQATYNFTPLSESPTFGRGNIIKGLRLTDVKNRAIPSATKYVALKDFLRVYNSDGSISYYKCVYDGTEGVESNVWYSLTQGQGLSELFEYSTTFDVPELSKVIKVAYKEGTNFRTLHRENYENFYTTTREKCYAVHPIGENKFQLMFKGVINTECMMVYATSMKFQENSVLEVPEEYLSLIHAALCYQLGLAFPALDQNKVLQMKAEKERLEDIIMAQNCNDNLFLKESGPVDYRFDRVDMWR